MDLNVILAQNLSAIRANRHLTQEACAGQCEISTRFWGKIERCEVSPSLNTLQKICSGIGVRPSDLLDDSKIQPKGMVKNMLHCQQANNECTVINWEYLVIPELCSHPDCGEYTSYGIHALQCQPGQNQMVTIVHDISTKQNFVEQLAARFTKYQLSPLHLKEVIEDFLP